jgi:large subunit ribosomal protein L9
MEIILIKDVDKVGDKYEMVQVKDGYARNYLIPQGMALIANNTNKRRLEEYKRRELAQATRMLDTYKAIAAQLTDKVLRIGAKAGTSGKIFGSVTNVQIAAALKDQFDIDIERRKVVLPEDVKNVGTYTAVLNLHPDVDAKVSFEVVAE